MNLALDTERRLLRHLLATIAFRGGLAVKDAPKGFAEFRAGETTRTAGEILAHLGDLMKGSLYLLKGDLVYVQTAPQLWSANAARFFSALRKLDSFLASENPLAQPVEKIMQGPLADALTHIGQIVLLRRLAGKPIREEAYFTAEIVAGEIDQENFAG